MSRKRFSSEQWRAWFEEFEANDLTVQQFCDLKGTTANTFYNWRRRLREALAADSTCLSGMPSERPCPTNTTFVSVSLAGSRIEFEFVGGVIARVENDCESLRPLVQVLQGAGVKQ